MAAIGTNLGRVIANQPSSGSGGGGGTSIYIAPTLPVSLQTSVAWHGDSKSLGTGDNSPAGTLLINAGNDQTGGPRQYALHLLYKFGIQLPVTWLKGALTATTLNMPQGMWKHECRSGETAIAAAAAFAARWAANPAAAIIASFGTNDCNNALVVSTPAQAAIITANAIRTWFDAVRAVDITIPILFYSPGAGGSNPGGTGTVKQAMLLALPLIQAQVAAVVALGQKVFFVDGTTGITGGDGSGLFFDSLHENALGYMAVAGRVVRGMFAFPF